MKFMLMMQGTKKGWESLSSWKPEEFMAHVAFMKGFNEELKRSGELVLAEGLDLPMNAKVVSATDSKAPTVSDGPFAEAKEFLAGFWIVEVPTAQRAIAIAAHASTAPGPGGKPLGIPIEIRQVMKAPDTPA
jgi:hypothetical protein